MPRCLSEDQNQKDNCCRLMVNHHESSIYPPRIIFVVFWWYTIMNHEHLYCCLMVNHHESWNMNITCRHHNCCWHDATESRTSPPGIIMVCRLTGNHHESWTSLWWSSDCKQSWIMNVSPKHHDVHDFKVT
jgi:hypothetical protein